METDKTLHVTPDKVLAEDNIRFSLLKGDVDQMKDDIQKMGRITTPLLVEELDKPIDGYKFKLIAGFRRYKAAVELNKDGAGLLLPISVVDVATDPIMRLKYQLSENLDRKNLSPMDMAKAIKELLDAGLSRLQVREMFKRPGGKKGTDLQPASNAWMNMTLSFLELDKATQTKIHSGQVGVAAAYELTKVAPEKRAEVLAKAEEKRLGDIQKEAREEEKYLKAEADVEETVKQEVALTTDLETAQADLEVAQRASEEATVAHEASHALYLKKPAAGKKADPKAKKALGEKWRASIVDMKGAEKKVEAAQKALDKILASKLKLSESAAALKEKLAAARSAAPKKGKAGRSKGDAVGAGDVKKAAQETGASTGAVRLTAADMRKTVDDLALVDYPKVAKLGGAFKACFDGVTTPSQLLTALVALLGDRRSGRAA